MAPLKEVREPRLLDNSYGVWKESCRPHRVIAYEIINPLLNAEGLAHRISIYLEYLRVLKSKKSRHTAGLSQLTYLRAYFCGVCCGTGFTVAAG